MPSADRPSPLALLSAAAVALAVAVVPLVWGDVYPFSSAPMFRDAPQRYCRYQVLGPQGQELPLDEFLLQRVYDGNPPGYGVGIQPPPTLCVFGEVQAEADVVAHVQRQLADRPGPEWVEVVQEVIGPVDAQHVGVIATHRWRVKRQPAGGASPGLR